ncbi:hypothetical protein L208DRAFT_1229569, partial [Tricholoma matsutake]
ILPSGIKNWLWARGLHWPCFCGLISGTSHSSQIVQVIGEGNVYAFCSSCPSKCHFYLNLTELHASAQRKSEYAHIPTLAVAFEMGPYFEGFCGKYVGDHAGSEQKCGSMLLVIVKGIHTPRGMGQGYVRVGFRV